MQYAEVIISINPYSQQNAEIITALLAELGFDSFSDADNGLMAYIPSEQLNHSDLKTLFSSLKLGCEINYNVNQVKEQNWNKEWESNFKPIPIKNLCYIRAPFHKSEEGYKLEVIIEPKMSFGTGHHQTTWLMARELFSLNLKNKKVLDMGCGTGILAIIAEKLGASKITAIDNDDWAYKNAKENVTLNNCTKISVLLGDSTLIEQLKFDIVLANINLNILLSDFGTYYNSLNAGGIILMSGIFTTDIDTLTSNIRKFACNVVSKKAKNDWALIAIQKK
ncbi:MAG: 50S ribosomal protein L11 methyltransferase [Bacteroidales bacterium]